MTLIVSTLHTVEMHQRGGWKGGTTEELTFRLRHDVDTMLIVRGQIKHNSLMRSNFSISVVRCSRSHCATAVLCPTDSRPASRLVCPCVCLASFFSAFVKYYSTNASSLPPGSPPTQVSHFFASPRRATHRSDLLC